MSDYPDWTSSTHSNNVEPDYSIVFPQNRVLRFDIVIDEAYWSEMQNDLASNLSGGGPGGPGGPGQTTSDFDPIWVPCTFKYNDTEWYQVGIRFKGNSSLKSAYQSGNNKLSFKLDFDEFEDDYPALTDQRFYGFKQLNLNNNFDDQSLMREKVGADLFREFGLPSARTSFCIVYVDRGDGPKYFGVYTIVEEMDDSVLDDQLGHSNGNLYKPDGDAASFASGSYNESEFEKKNNEIIGDYSDVLALYNAINSNDRLTNTAAWKTQLESCFNVNQFLKWLAANAVIQNWDTYGRMTHNYYLYNDPNTNTLGWIPWDNNEAFQYGKMGGALSLSMDEVGNNWPLIRYIMDDADYKAIYQTHMRNFTDQVFTISKMTSTYDNFYSLIKEHAYNEVSGYSYISSSSSFEQAIITLKTHVSTRNSVVDSYLP
jgi:spore coat protein CotH